MLWLDTFVVALLALLVFVAAVTLLSGLDEFLLDLIYLFRVLPVKRGSDAHPVLREDDLNAMPEQPIAVMIPAWNEGGVIRRMIENTIETLRYSNYQIFVGSYPNDEATSREVELVRERYDNVHRAVVPQDGPTNKADCLNAVWRRIREHEELTGQRFEVVVQHDAEDLVHPYSLKVFNLYQPKVDMLQIPVFSLETDWREFTGSHYVDEFCEHHIKSIPVRDILTGSVPSAGVGCGFSRRALESELHTGSGPFNERSLTEDYDFATRLSLAGYSTRFLRPILARREMRERGLFRKRMEEVEREEIIATREYFPDELQPAIRQKSRWILGISIQGWRQIGWKGNFWMRYMLMRDRKTLMTSQVNVLGYVVLAGLAFLYLAGLLDPNEYVYPGLVESRTWLWYLILADTFFLIWRLILRAHCVYVVYGWTQAVWSAPRLVWGNFISFFATNRAIWLWLRSRLSGKPFQWEKTAHVFPTDETISSFRQRLGDLLLERRWVRVADLESALARQKTDPRLLGEILREMGVVEEEQIFQALALQWRLTSVAVDASATPLDALRLLPQKMAIQHRIYPLRLINGSRLQVAVDRLPPRAEMEQVEAALGRRLEFLLSTSSGLDRAIAQGYARLNGGNGAHA